MLKSSRRCDTDECGAAVQSHALVVEDQDLMRMALMEELRPLIEEGTVHGASTLKSALALCSEHEFGLVLIDPGLPDVRPTAKSRLTVVEEIIESAPEAIHIVVTGSDSEAESQACQKLGANAYVSKVGLDRERFQQIISKLADGSYFVSYSEIRKETPEFVHNGLTSREQEVVDLFLRQQKGIRRREAFKAIGEKLRISPDSAESYFKRARAKLLRRGISPRRR